MRENLRSKRLIGVSISILLLSMTAYVISKKYEAYQEGKVMVTQTVISEKREVALSEKAKVVQSGSLPSETRYYAGTIGNKKVHLFYTPLGENNNHFFVSGKLVYDGVSERPVDISIDFTSGGAMDGGATVDGKDGKTIATFTNRNLSKEKFLECEKENKRCGEWTDAGGAKTGFVLTPSQPFNIEDFLK